MNCGLLYSQASSFRMNQTRLVRSFCLPSQAAMTCTKAVNLSTIRKLKSDVIWSEFTAAINKTLMFITLREDTATATTVSPRSILHFQAPILHVILTPISSCLARIVGSLRGPPALLSRGLRIITSDHTATRPIPPWRKTPLQSLQASSQVSRTSRMALLRCQKKSCAISPSSAKLKEKLSSQIKPLASWSPKSRHCQIHRRRCHNSKLLSWHSQCPTVSIQAPMSP